MTSRRYTNYTELLTTIKNCEIYARKHGLVFAIDHYVAAIPAIGDERDEDCFDYEQEADDRSELIAACDVYVGATIELWKNPEDDRRSIYEFAQRGALVRICELLNRHKRRIADWKIRSFADFNDGGFISSLVYALHEIADAHKAADV